MMNASEKKKWKSLVLEQAKSGLPIKTWCKKNKLKDSTFHVKRKELIEAGIVDDNRIRYKPRKKKEKPTFGICPTAENIMIEIKHGGKVCVKVHIPGNCRPEYIAKLVGLLSK